jgi:crotonobetainyl-CoA:carnitine CoA-transferase CaiB-like acyl-CoA transferase
VQRTKSLPLDGLLVVDFSRVLAGPLVAMTLGDLGADVIKVEAPHGDDTRRLASACGRPASCVVPLRGEPQQAVDRARLDYERIAARNGGAVNCEISGFGERAVRDLPGYDPSSTSRCSPTLPRAAPPSRSPCRSGPAA